MLRCLRRMPASGMLHVLRCKTCRPACGAWGEFTHMALPYCTAYAQVWQHAQRTGRDSQRPRRRRRRAEAAAAGAAAELCMMFLTCLALPAAHHPACYASLMPCPRPAVPAEPSSAVLCCPQLQTLRVPKAVSDQEGVQVGWFVPHLLLLRGSKGSAWLELRRLGQCKGVLLTTETRAAAPLQVEVTRLLVASYFDIVRKNLQVPRVWLLLPLGG